MKGIDGACCEQKPSSTAQNDPRLRADESMMSMIDCRRIDAKAFPRTPHFDHYTAVDDVQGQELPARTLPSPDSLS